MRHTPLKKELEEMIEKGLGTLLTRPDLEKLKKAKKIPKNFEPLEGSQVYQCTIDGKEYLKVIKNQCDASVGSHGTIRRCEVHKTDEDEEKGHSKNQKRRANRSEVEMSKDREDILVQIQLVTEKELKVTDYTNQIFLPILRKRHPDENHRQLQKRLPALRNSYDRHVKTKKVSKQNTQHPVPSAVGVDMSVEQLEPTVGEKKIVVCDVAKGKSLLKKVLLVFMSFLRTLDNGKIFKSTQTELQKTFDGITIEKTCSKCLVEETMNSMSSVIVNTMAYDVDFGGPWVDAHATLVYLLHATNRLGVTLKEEQKDLAQFYIENTEEKSLKLNPALISTPMCNFIGKWERPGKGMESED